MDTATAEPAPLSSLSGHVVVAGADAFAAHVLRELDHLGEPVVALVEQADCALAEEARERGTPTVVGRAREERTLRETGIDRAEAVAFLFDSDVGNLHAALVVKDVAPDVLLVLRMFNTTFGHHAQRLLGECTVLSEAEIAAPAFSHAAMFGDSARPVELQGRALGVREVDCHDPAIQLALADADDQSALFPEPDDVPRVLALVDEEPEHGGTTLGEAAAQFLRATTLTPAQTLVILARELATHASGRIAAAFGLLSTIVLVSALIFWLGLDISPLDAVYFSVVTVGTVGYGDINLLDAPALLKVYGIFLVLAGGVTIAVLYALVTDAIVGLRLAAALGDPKPPTEDHVIVCGLGNVGSRVLQELCARGVPCVGVERDDEAPGLPEVRRLGIPVVAGDVSRAETLERLSVPTCRAVVAVTDDDVANLECALSARALAPGARVVVRLADADLAARVERAVDIHISRSVAAIAAPSFVAALLGRRLLATIPVGSRTLRVRPLQAASPTTVRDVEELAGEARVLSVGSTWRPDATTPVQAGDPMLVIGTMVGLARVERSSSV